MTNSQTSNKLENLVAYPLMIVIGFYMTASAVVPFLDVNPQIFSTVVTLSGGIPAITLFFKERFSRYTPIESEGKTLSY